MLSSATSGAAGRREKDFNLCWIGSMVADIHRILTRGGIYLYPKDSKDSAKPGRLRLMYEANPMVMLVEHVERYHTAFDKGIDESFLLFKK